MSSVYAFPFQFALPNSDLPKTHSFELTESVPLRLTFNEKVFFFFKESFQGGE